MFKLFPRKEITRTFGSLTRHIPMTDNVIEWNLIMCAENIHQKNERIELAFRNPSFRKITHQLNPNPIFIHSGSIAMRPIHLFDPARPRFNLPCRFPEGAVIDKEMIPEAVPKTTPMMHLIDRQSAPFIRRTVMNNYVRPRAGLIKRNYRAFLLFLGNKKLLTNRN